MFLRTCRRILRNGVLLLKKRGNRLNEQERNQFENELRALDRAVLAKNRREASEIATHVRSFIKAHFPKSVFDHLRELVYALGFAIIVAFLIRQFWFELYEVPTGSMRPTVMELDRMVVSKTPFGLNLPFLYKPLFFSENMVKRGGIIVFTTEGMDIPDSDMLYFRIFPGKKRFIKRAMGKPGDTVYFYGGLLYGIDREGNPIIDLADSHFLQQHGLQRIDHIPYITFDGKMSVGKPMAPNIYDSVQIKQMNRTIGKMQLNRTGKIESSFYNGQAWVPDMPEALKAPHDKPVSFSDLWGMGNYAMARIITREEAHHFYDSTPGGGDTDFYLELHHTPNLTYPKPEMRRDEMGRIHPMITPFSTLIPLNQNHLESVQKAMITARFLIENGRAYRYHEGKTRPQRPEFDPKFPGVPNGMYEFYYGVGYKVHFGGIRTKLPPNHPLYSLKPDNIRNLFNLGIGFNIVFEPIAANQTFNPQRFAYFREGDLYLMGAPIIKKSDPVLIRFIQSEQEREERSTREAPYIAFVDHGPPLKEGQIDREFIEAFGLKIPEDGVLALGDNFAMSADSRDFGFTPTENLRGAPSFTFWPPGSRVGPLPQPPYPWITLSNMLVWSAVLIIAIISWLYLRKRNQTSHFD